MKIIVPVDFSAVAKNAAEFAVQMVRDKHAATIILYHMYNDATEAVLAYKHLEWLKESYECKYGVKIDCKAEQGENLVNCLSRLVRFEDADLLVMAVTERSKMVAESFSLQMIAQSICPVLVIPPAFSYKEVKNIAIASDFKNVEQVIPLVPVRKLLDLFHPSLHIVNVDSKFYISPDEEHHRQKEVLQAMFGEYKPEFHFINTYGFHETLRRFIADKNIDLVLTFPRKHSFFNSLIKGNNTRKLVYEAEVPVLAAHE